MKILSQQSPDAFADVPDSAKPDEMEKQKIMASVSRHLTDVLMSENLVVLSGLGTSMCVVDEKGQRRAPSMVALWDSVKTADSGSFDDAIKATDYKKHKEATGIKEVADGYKNVEELLTRCQMVDVLMPGRLRTFIDSAEKVIAKAVRFVKPGEELKTHEEFLRRVARRSTSKPRLKLFTTNYDLCFEQAASQLRFVVVDGFSHTNPQEFDGSYFDYDMVRRHQDRDVPDYIPSVFHLCKLHGSVDWKREADGRIIKDASAEQPLLIYPRSSKYEASYDPPFLEMMSRLQSSLRRPNTGLLVVGFGFHDHHISQPVLAAVRSNIGLRAVFVDPGFEGRVGTKDLHDPVVSIAQLISARDPRLTILNATFEEVVTRIPDLVAATEEEEHHARMRANGGGK